MGHKPKAPMPVSERAKIFAPFAALKGLPEALAEKEKVREPKKELSEEMEEELNSVLVSLQKGQIVTAVYYNSKEQQYTQLTGEFVKADKLNQTLEISETEILFDNLYRLITK